MSSRERMSGNGKKNILFPLIQAFKELKEKIISQPVLVLSRRKGKFRVETDTSGYTIGGVLSQEQEEK